MEETSVDLINYALEDNPTKMGDVFNNLVMQKVADAVSVKKQELAQSMFADGEADEETLDQEDDQLTDDTNDQQNNEDEDKEEQDEDTQTDA